MDTATAPTLGPHIDVTEYTRDRWADNHPPIVIPLWVKALRAQLVTRTAMEIYDPEKYPADALLWATDLRRVADHYWVPLPVAARYVHSKAITLALTWRRQAEATS